jgi:hypothetical protein
VLSGQTRKHPPKDSPTPLGSKVIDYLSLERIRHGESRRYPAESVDDVSGQAIDDALYRATHVLRRRDDKTAGHQQRRGEEIVHPEDSTVHHYVLGLEIVLQPS